MSYCKSCSTGIPTGHTCNGLGLEDDEDEEMVQPENWEMHHQMFGHYSLNRKDASQLDAIMFRRHEIPDIIAKLQHFYNTGEL